MVSKLLLSKSDPDIAEATKDCKVGDTKTFEITVEVTRDDDKVFEGDVTGLTYGESEPEGNMAEEEAKLMPKRGETSTRY